MKFFVYAVIACINNVGPHNTAFIPDDYLQYSFSIEVSKEENIGTAISGHLAEFCNKRRGNSRNIQYKPVSVSVVRL